MDDTIQKLSESARVRLTADGDLICRKCPHNQEGVCDCNEKVQRYDNAVLSLCGLSEGQTLSWVQLQSLMQSGILETGGLKTVCGDCQWYGICGKK